MEAGSFRCSAPPHHAGSPRTAAFVPHAQQFRGDRLHAPVKERAKLRATLSAHPNLLIDVPIRHKPAAPHPRDSPSPRPHGDPGTLFRSNRRSTSPPPVLTMSSHATAWSEPPPHSCQGQVRPPCGLAPVLAVLPSALPRHRVSPFRGPSRSCCAPVVLAST
jgi:hypothetical protein